MPSGDRNGFDNSFMITRTYFGVRLQCSQHNNGVVDRVWITKYQDNPRGVAAEELFELTGKVARQQSLNIETAVAQTPDLAWQAATDSLDPTDVLCCTGSVFLIAELIDLAKAK